MKVPLLDLKAQYLSIKDEIKAAIDEVLETQRFILGPKVEELEIRSRCVFRHRCSACFADGPGNKTRR